MYTHYSDYTYVPAPVRQETKWRFGWNSCMLFIANLMFFALCAIVPGIPTRLALVGTTFISSLGILSAMSSILFGKFWLSKVYATCGLIGNFSLLLWLLLSL